MAAASWMRAVARAAMPWRFTDATEARVAGWLRGLSNVAKVNIWTTRDQRRSENQTWLNMLVEKA
jgi:hypothetical protein